MPPNRSATLSAPTCRGVSSHASHASHTMFRRLSSRPIGKGFPSAVSRSTGTSAKPAGVAGSFSMLPTMILAHPGGVPRAAALELALAVAAGARGGGRGLCSPTSGGGSSPRPLGVAPTTSAAPLAAPHWRSNKRRVVERQHRVAPPQPLLVESEHKLGIERPAPLLQSQRRACVCGGVVGVEPDGARRRR